MTVPFYNLKSENQELTDDFLKAFDHIIHSGIFVIGPELNAFERELAAYLRVNQVLGLKSGTDALEYGLRALGIGPGDEVITSPFTFEATVAAITRIGAQPVFADIDPKTLCLDPDRCTEVISSRSRAIVLVHLFGNCADLDRFVELCHAHKLELIEDAAQALGAEYQGRKLGGFGTAAIFSFYPTKNLGALGNGGALVIDRELKIPNSARLDELQAAVLRIKLSRLDRWTEQRRQIAKRYRQTLSGLVRIVSSAPNSLPNFHQFALLTPHRDRLRQFLQANGIDTRVYYPAPLYPLPVAQMAAKEVLCLPVRPSLTSEEQEFIISKIQDFFQTAL